MDSGNEIDLPTRADLASWAAELGFDALGITNVDLSDHEPHVQAYLDAKFHGEMGYLERNLQKRLHPEQLVPGTVRVISARMNYLAADTRPLEILQDSRRAYISRYALGRDYHKVLRRRLAKLASRIDSALASHQYRAFTDSAPVLEKALGVKAGLGWMGKHTLLLDQSVGSWFFLGEIYTNAPLPIDTTQATSTDACGKCNACITVCPTDAIVGPRVLDARRCISYLTIEHKGVIPEPLREPIGNRVFGCDDCQLFCPWNRDPPESTEADFKPRHGLDDVELIDLFKLSEAQFLKLTEGSAMRRIGYEQWQRNLSVALGNGPATSEAISALSVRVRTASPLLKEHIDWALSRLANPAKPTSPT
ncbi:MAG: tRNA epoxyqueuosine(34) reductase QueG [Pseudomonadales bacterium]|nr:tRNA epoxyqueuosine(34) reductase QueG [Pseudomonadales bacterium]